MSNNKNICLCTFLNLNVYLVSSVSLHVFLFFPSGLSRKPNVSHCCRKFIRVLFGSYFAVQLPHLLS